MTRDLWSVSGTTHVGAGTGGWFVGRSKRLQVSSDKFRSKVWGQGAVHFTVVYRRSGTCGCKGRHP